MQDGQTDRLPHPRNAGTLRPAIPCMAERANGRYDERGVALLLAILVLALLVALILEFDSDARREYREASAFRDNFKATVLTRAAVQAARAVLQQDHLRDKQTGQMYDSTTDLWAFPIDKYAIGDGLMTAQIEDERFAGPTVDVLNQVRLAPELEMLQSERHTVNRRQRGSASLLQSPVRC